MTRSNPKQSWGIVGAGLLGMTLALRLAQQNKAVTLIEAGPQLGGVAAPWRLGDVVWDRHYHVTLQADGCLLSLLRELGLHEDLEWKRARTGFYVQSGMHSLSSTMEFLRFSPLNMIEKARLAMTVLKASQVQDATALEHTPVEDWLKAWSGRGVTQKIWLPLLRAKLGDAYRDTSAAFISTTIARMYSARRTGAKAETFGYVRGGYATILRAFEDLLVRSGVSIRLGQPVRSVKRTCGGELRIESGRECLGDFSHVAVTTPAPLAAEICSGLLPDEKDRLYAIRYQGLVCASLLLKRPLSSFYITNIADPDLPFTAVIEMSAIVDRRQFGGNSLVYLPKYLNPTSPQFGMSYAQIREEFLAGIGSMFPNFHRSDVECFQVSRVKHLLPIPTINYSANVPSFFTSVPGLHIVNSAQIVNGTLNVDETIRLAEGAAERFVEPQTLSNSKPALLWHGLAPSHS